MGYTVSMMSLLKWLIGILSIACLVLVFFILKVHLSSASEGTPSTIISPLPSFLTDSPFARSLDYWVPKDQVLGSSIAKPEITADVGFIYDVTTDQVIFDKNSKEKKPIASLTKLMTAALVLEVKKPSDSVVISEKAADVGENAMGVTTGEKYTVEDLLYGLVLNSGNDAAMALAESVSGNTDTFVKEMNRKAKIMGLTQSSFVNPSGLEEDNGMMDYSSARDLVAITKYVLSYPVFADVAKTAEYHIPYTSLHKEIYLENQTNLVTTYPGVKGVKTGYTPSAGLCLVTYAENGGHKLIGVVLNSQSRRDDMRELLDYSFKTLGVHVPGRT